MHIQWLHPSTGINFLICTNASLEVILVKSVLLKSSKNSWFLLSFNH